MGMKKEAPGDLLQGTLDLLILKALACGAMHGYAVAEWIHESSQDVLRVEEGALYPALHRLELRGLLSAEWGASENNRRAKFYSLTAAGRKKLTEEAEYWRRMSGAIARVMQTAREKKTRNQKSEEWGVRRIRYENLDANKSTSEAETARKGFG